MNAIELKKSVTCASIFGIIVGKFCQKKSHTQSSFLKLIKTQK